MKRTLFVIAAVALIATARAAGIPNGGFEDGMEGWRTFFGTPEKAVSISTESPAEGDRCLVLASQDDAGAGIRSTPSDLSTDDGLIEVSCQYRAISKSGRLSARLGSADLPLWAEREANDDRWHHVRLVVQAHPEELKAASLFFAVTGEGTWAVDDVSVEAADMPGYGDHERFAPDAVYPEPLEPGWEPGGDLDARSRQLVGQKELIVNVGPLKIVLPAEAECEVGIRDGIGVFCTNHSGWERDLTIRMQGPPGTRVPDWTVPIAKNTHMEFHLPVQCMQPGDHYVRLTFTMEDQSASAPVLLHCRQRYPVFGIGMSARFRPQPETLSAATAIGCPLRWVLKADAGDLDISGLSRPIVATIGSSREHTPDQTIAGIQPIDAVDFWTPSTSGVSSVTGLAQAVADAGGTPRMMTGFVPLEYDDEAGRLRPVDPDAFHRVAELLNEDSIAGHGGLNSMMLEPLPSPAPAVLASTVDGQAISRPLANAVDLNRRTDLAPIRKMAREAGANLSFSMVATWLESTGHRELDAVRMARVIASNLYQGVTGYILPNTSTRVSTGLFENEPVNPNDPVAQVVRALSGELTGSVPVMPLSPTEGMSPKPDAKVQYTVFLRGREGIVVMWNNTGRPIDVAVEFRSQPVTCKLLRFSPQEPVVTEQFMPIFERSQAAKDRRELAIYQRLDPSDLVCVSAVLVSPHLGWLRTIKPKPPAPDNPRKEPKYDRRPWWEKLGDD